MPDVDRFELDLEIAETTVSGTVVDQDGGAPVPDASVGLMTTEGDGRGGGSETGPDGRFSIAVEPGEYRLEARGPRPRGPPPALNVGPSEGRSDVRVEMERGLDLRGRVLDSAGRPGPGSPDPGQPLPTARAPATRTPARSPTARFRIDGLAAKPYALVGGSELPGCAFRRGVTPGDEPVDPDVAARGADRRARASIRRGSRSRTPIREVETIDGLRVRMPGRARVRRTRAASSRSRRRPASWRSSSDTGAGTGRGTRDRPRRRDGAPQRGAAARAGEEALTRTSAALGAEIADSSDPSSRSPSE